jgi:hypothetical protein
MAEEPDLIAELYAAPSEQFVAERTKLVRRLRDEGRAEEARDVASLRKPTVPASLANRLAHEHPREVAALLDAAQKLASAHGSGDAEKLRGVQRELGDRVRALIALAPSVSGTPVSGSVGQRLAETLRAGATDPETAPLLRRGVLQAEVETSGFEALASLNLPPAKRSAKAADKPTRRGGRQDARVEQLRKDLAAAKRDLRSAESAAAAAEREATRARKRVSDLEARFEHLSQL